MFGERLFGIVSLAVVMLMIVPPFLIGDAKLNYAYWLVLTTLYLIYVAIYSRGALR